MRQIILGIMLVTGWSVLWAQESTEVPNPPAIPTEEERSLAEEAAKERESAAEGDDETRGIQEKETVEGTTTVTEYSRGGHIYSLKMKQKYGATQYVDVKEDGQLQQRTNEGLSDDVNLPKWRITGW